MKSENIPPDIRIKSIKEAQKEIKELIAKLENPDSNPDDPETAKALYKRVFQLDQHIKELFKEKAEEINQTTLNKNKKNLLKDSK